MSEFELDQYEQEADIMGLTFTPANFAYAYNVNNELLQFSFQVNEDNNLKLQLLSKVNLKKRISSFFVVPEANLILAHAGQNILLLNATTMECKKLFDKVLQLIPHHPGYEPTLVPLLQSPSNQLVDLQYTPIHTTFYGCLKTAFASIKPYNKTDKKYALFDFIIIQESGFSLIVVNNPKIKDVCCQFGINAVNTILIDNQINNTQSNQQIDPMQSKFEFQQQLSNLNLNNQQIEEMRFVGDFLYFKIQNNYLYLDLKQFCFIQEILQIKNQQLLNNISQFAQQLIQCQQNELLGDIQLQSQEFYSKQQQIQLLGCNCQTSNLVNSTVAELNKRVKRGFVISKKPQLKNSLENEQYGGYLLNQQQYAEQILLTNDQQDVQQIINESNSYQHLNNFYLQNNEQSQLVYCYNLLREQNQDKQSPFNTSTNVQQLQLMSNSGLHKLVDTCCEQLEMQILKQTAPHVYLLVPQIICFDLNNDEFYCMDTENWSRPIQNNILQSGFKAMNARCYGLEVIEVGRQQIQFNCNNQLNTMNTQQLNEIQFNNVQIMFSPQKSDRIAQQYSEMIEKNNQNIQISSFVIKYIVKQQETNKLYKISRKRHSQVLIQKILNHLNGIEVLKQETIVSTRNEANIVLQNLQDRLESSRVNTCIALMYFLIGSYNEAVIALLQARLVNPVSVVSLFLYGIKLNQLTNQVLIQRCEQPAQNMIEQCQLFGLFKEFLLQQFSDTTWNENICKQSNYQQVDLLEYLNTNMSKQEVIYQQYYSNFTFDQIFNQIDMKYSNKEQHSILLNNSLMLQQDNIQQNIQLSYDNLTNSNPEHNSDDGIRRRVKYLAYYLRVYLDVKSNWTSPLRQVLRNCQLQNDRQFIDQFITPNVNLVNNKQIVRLDEQILILRTILVVLLSAKPFSIKSQECVVFFLNKPEEMHQIQNIKRAPVMLTNTYCEIQDYNNSIGLLTFLKHYAGASKLCDMLRQNELNQKEQYTYTVCLLNTMGIDDILVNNDNNQQEWELYKELVQLQLDKINQKIIFWQFLPYIVFKKPKLALEFLEQQLTYINNKTGKQIKQYLFFEKLPIRESGSLVGYYKPQNKEEQIKDFSKTFTPQLVAQFLGDLRYKEIESRFSNTVVLQEQDRQTYNHHRALASLFTYYASKSVYFAFEDYQKINYNQKAPNWNNAILKQWLNKDAGAFILEYITIYCDNDEPQKKFSQSCAIHLEQLVNNYKKVLQRLDQQKLKLQMQSKQSQLSNQINLDDGFNNLENSQENEEPQIIRTKQPLKQEDIKSVISEAKQSAQPIYSEHNSEFNDDNNEDQFDQLSGCININNICNANLLQQLQEQQINQLYAEYKDAYNAFYRPYILCSIKYGDVDTAVNSLFRVTFKEADFDSTFSFVFKLYLKKIIKTKINDTNTKELQSIFQQIPELSNIKRYTLVVSRFEEVLSQSLVMAEPFMKTLIKQQKFDSIEKCVQCDCLNFIGLDDIGDKNRSPVNLLYELLIRYNICYQCNMISKETFNLIIQRMINVETKCGEYLAKYCGVKILDILPQEFPVKYVNQFVALSMRLITDNSAELAIEKLKNDYENKVLNTNNLSMKQQQYKLDAFVKCSVCQKPLLRQGSLQSQYVVLQEPTIQFIHEECYDGPRDWNNNSNNPKQNDNQINVMQ